MKKKRKNEYYGLVLFMLMEIDWKEAHKEGSIKAIDDWIKKWGGLWAIKEEK